MTWRIGFFVCPTLVFLALNISLGPLIRKSESEIFKAAGSVGLSLIGFIILLWTIRFFANKASLLSPTIGNPINIWLGLAIGSLLSVASGASYGLLHGSTISWGEFFGKLGSTLYTQVPSAVTEEIVFRFGIVQGAAVLGGPIVGLAAGSIPFGLLHLIDLFFGNPIDAAQVIGIILAGGLLSLIYLRWGLWAAIGCHYSWNVLCAPWVYGLGMDRSVGYTQLEGAWTTSFFIVLACLMLLPKTQLYLRTFLRA